ncbi:SKP1-like protein 11 [Salvia miltiorrhiza]|uniref:SKP1-like protein 11 n=1 Tax=Salvia miltiorrhiza TaxID=226208 RepID=UPI0025ACEC2D|nr:SKP1-like protein 11 [Salvia miltiorrhiza]
MAEISAEERTLTLLSSDGERFMVPEAAAVQSKTIKNIVEDGCSGGPIPLANVSSKVLAEVIVFLKNHANGSEIEEQKKSDETFLKEIADRIRDKSPEWVRNLFGIENDYTPEEEEAVRMEYAWAFDDINDD